jgi:hypothetical protein
MFARKRPENLVFGFLTNMLRKAWVRLSAEPFAQPKEMLRRVHSEHSNVIILLEIPPFVELTRIPKGGDFVCR